MRKKKSNGHIIGKYGIDVFLTLGTAKGVKAFVEFRQASAVLTFETSLKTERNALEIQRRAQAAQLARSPENFLDRHVRLKNAKSAIIEDAKITNFALTNPRKSKGFREVLGYNETNWEDLKDKIKQGMLENKAKFHKVDMHGVKFTVDMSIDGPKKRVNVRTGWIYRNGEEKPRLTTLFLHDES